MGTTDSLWVYIGNTLFGERWGYGFFYVSHLSVGVNGRVNVTVPLTVQGSKDYFSVSVFTASRSCSLDSHFYLEASDPIAFDFQANANSFLEGSRDTWSWNRVVWNKAGTEVTFQNYGTIGVAPVQSNVYTLSFTMTGTGPCTRSVANSL